MNILLAHKKTNLNITENHKTTLCKSLSNPIPENPAKNKYEIHENHLEIP